MRHDDIEQSFVLQFGDLWQEGDTPGLTPFGRWAFGCLREKCEKEGILLSEPHEDVSGAEGLWFTATKREEGNKK